MFSLPFCNKSKEKRKSVSHDIMLMEISSPALPCHVFEKIDDEIEKQLLLLQEEKRRSSLSSNLPLTLEKG
jgi:hypothetical protein